MRRRSSKALIVSVFISLGCGGGGGSRDGGPGTPTPVPPFEPKVDLRADVNRDGVADLADPSDDAGEETWTPAAGAIILANLDDDLGRCPFAIEDGPDSSDAALAACNDAADEVVNGPDDALDLAPLAIAPWPAAPDDAVGSLVVGGPAATRIRIFRRTGAAYEVVAPGAELRAADLRAGLTLAVEATDVVRDPAAWDGGADITLRVQRRGAPATAVEDRVQLRVAPIILTHHLLPARTLVASDIGSADAASVRFRGALEEVRAAAGIADGLAALPMAWTRDRWTQDYFEDAYSEMPSPGGPQRMRVLLRSAFVEDQTALYSPLRRASRVVYRLRGKDVAVVQQFELGQTFEMRTLDSMGNTEVVPPHEHAGVSYPFGRILRGSTAAFHPDPSMAKLLAAQGVQPPILLDTSWLFVGHVDETLAFVASTTAPRGWVALVADPPRARALLQELAAAGQGDSKLFAGLVDARGNPVERTVSEVLADAAVATASATATARIAAQLDVLRAEVGLADEEIVRVPVLFAERSAGRLAAYTTNTVNLLAPVPGVVAAPDPHGPAVGGVDPFRAELESLLAPHGVGVVWVDTWSYLHVNIGEIHCGTNALRVPPLSSWWSPLAR